MKTVRFSQVVAQSGKPQPYTLWLDPKLDTAFQQALKANRIMTVRQETTGTKADYGEIGYTGARGELLLFPKSLIGFEGKRVVGVKYDLLDVPAPATKDKSATARKPKSSSALKRKDSPSPKTPPANIVQFVGVKHDDHEDDSDASSEPVEPAKSPLRSVPLTSKTPAKSKKPAAQKTKHSAVEASDQPASSKLTAALDQTTPSAKAPGRSRENSLPAERKKKSEAESSIATAKPAAPMTSTPAGATTHQPSTSSSALRLLQRAMRDLKDGRVVKAYERLQELERQIS